MRIGILGGSFDPVHNGHIALSKTAILKLNLDKVLFVPAWQAPHKHHKFTKEVQTATLENAKHRVKMLELALLHFEKGEICNLELERKGISFTVDTVQALKKIYKQAQLFLLIGQDNYNIFESWREPKTILELCSVVVFRRCGYDSLIQKPFIAIEVELPNISSSEIRKKICNGLSIKDDVSEEVEKYISENVLYKKI